MWKTLVAMLTVLSGCGSPSRPTIKLNSGSAVDPLGVRFMDDDELQREIDKHKRNQSFFGAYGPEEYDEWIDSKDGGELYATLNGTLHERVENALREYFRDAPLPEPNLHVDRDASQPTRRYRAFSYQNRDWFDTNSRINVQVAGDFVSRDLIETLQHQLSGNLEEWGILMFAPPSTYFDARDPFAIFITHDRTLVSNRFAKTYRSNTK